MRLKADPARMAGPGSTVPNRPRRPRSLGCFEGWVLASKLGLPKQALRSARSPRQAINRSSFCSHREPQIRANPRRPARCVQCARGVVAVVRTSLQKLAGPRLKLRTCASTRGGTHPERSVTAHILR
jgi:hypothetical protein